MATRSFSGRASFNILARSIIFSLSLFLILSVQFFFNYRKVSTNSRAVRIGYSSFKSVGIFEKLGKNLAVCPTVKPFVDGT